MADRVTRKPTWTIDGAGADEVWRCIAAFSEQDSRGAAELHYQVAALAEGRGWFAARAESDSALKLASTAIGAGRATEGVTLLGIEPTHEGAIGRAEDDWKKQVHGREIATVIGSVKILVITQCTGSKMKSGAPAERLYLGRGHQALMDGVDLARGAGISVEVMIVSALHGLVNGAAEIAPYDQTFAGKRDSDNRVAGVKLKIPQAVKEALAAGGYDLALVALGRDYMVAAGAEFYRVDPAGPVVNIVGAGPFAEIGRWIVDAFDFPLDGEDLVDFGSAHVNLKGVVAGFVCRAIGRRGTGAVLSAMKEGLPAFRTFVLENGRPADR